MLEKENEKNSQNPVTANITENNIKPLPKLLVEFLELYNEKKISAAVFGTEKRCYYFKGKAILKNKRPFKEPAAMMEFLADLDYRKQRLNQIKKSGIRTPKIIGAYRQDDYIFQVQEKAKGSPIFIANELFAMKMALGNLTKKHKCIPSLEPEDKLKVGKKVFEYNFEMQRSLQIAPQQHYDKFIADFIMLNAKFSINSFDNNPGNFLYDKEEGFSLVDLDIMPRKKKENGELLCDIIDIFAQVVDFGEYMSNEHVDQLLTSNKKIIEKILKAAHRNGMDFSNEEKEGIKYTISTATTKQAAESLNRKVDELCFASVPVIARPFIRK